ncbi:MAG: hypothetical protein AB1435_02340 [Chloroflexota bacterium]
MRVWLLANVGNSDLQIDNSKLPTPPAAEDPQRWWTPRRIGEAVRDNPDRFAETIKLPLLEPTINWLFEHENVTGADLRLVLFASDQPREDTLESEWQKDTYPIAEALCKIVTGKPFHISQKQARIERILGSPADYSNMLSFYTQALPKVAKMVAPDDRIFLEVSGGTPAMASMLIVMGVEVFGERVRTLYVERGATVPYEVSVSRELFARKTRDTLCDQVKLHAYAVALQTLKDAGPLIDPDDDHRQLLAAVLNYADRRLSFDFDRARNALQNARQLSIGEAQARIGRWLRELEAPDTAAHLSELIHSASIKLSFGDYADFVQRAFRFQEASFRYMLEQVGVEYSDKNGKYVKSEWLQSQPGLTGFLENYLNPQTKLRDPVKLDRPLNRYSLGAMVDFFVQTQKSWKCWHASAQQLHRLSAVADLRNKGVSGHGFDGIGQDDLEQAYAAPVDKLLDDLRAIYEALFKQPPGPNPYDAINALILDLIQAAP